MEFPTELAAEGEAPLRSPHRDLRNVRGILHQFDHRFFHFSHWKYPVEESALKTTTNSNTVRVKIGIEYVHSDRSKAHYVCHRQTGIDEPNRGNQIKGHARYVTYRKLVRYETDLCVIKDVEI